MANQYRSVLAGAGGTGGDALPAEVLAGKTFTNDNGPQTGSMINRGAVSGSATPSQPYTIPEGYHNGSGVVNASITLTGHYYPQSEIASLSNTLTGMTISDGYLLLERAAPTALTKNGVAITATTEDHDGDNYFGLYHLTNIVPSDQLFITARVASIVYV